MTGRQFAKYKFKYINKIEIFQINQYFIINRYESRKGHKSGNHNHQGYRGKKSDQVSSSIADDKHTHTHTHARSNKSNEKITSSESLAKEIEQASTIRPQGKQSHYQFIYIIMIEVFVTSKSKVFTN